MVEMVVAIVVAGILVAIAMPAFAGARSQLAVRDARQVYASLHGRARAHAVEFGEMVEVHVDTSADSMWIERDGETMEGMNVRSVMGVDIQGTSTRYTLCLNSRGYGDPACTSFGSAVTISFVAQEETASVEVLPLGQVSY